MSTISFHPLANLFPLMEGLEFERLCADIKAHGLLEPIILFEGQVLDGRNRYHACDTIKIQPHFKTFEGDDPLSHVLSLNLERRHLDESQRAFVVAKIANLGEGRPCSETASIEAVSQADAADKMNVSRARQQPYFISAADGTVLSIGPLSTTTALFMT